MSTYNYAHTDFLNDIFNEDSLKLAIEASEDITTELVLPRISSKEIVDENGDPTGAYTVTFHFATDLSSAEQTALSAIVAAHPGTPPTTVTFHASSVLTDAEATVTDTDPNWTELGGSVTTPDFFTSNLAYCKGRVVGQVKSNGTGGKLRVREDDSTPTGGFDVPDTEGEWTQMQWFTSDAPTAGTHVYTLEGQLPSSGATVVMVRRVAISLLEFG